MVRLNYSIDTQSNTYETWWSLTLKRHPKASENMTHDAYGDEIRLQLADAEEFDDACNRSPQRKSDFSLLTVPILFSLHSRCHSTLNS